MAALPWPVQAHLGLALLALILGPGALWARKGSALHRSLGYTWVSLMLGTALSSLFIFDHSQPNLGGYTWIHLLTLGTLAGLSFGVYQIVVRHNVTAHRKAMRGTYFGACIGAGLFTLLPGRFLGHWLWHEVLGWM
jgi:uncharacterized membrane protein